MTEGPSSLLGPPAGRARTSPWLGVVPGQGPWQAGGPARPGRTRPISSRETGSSGVTCPKALFSILCGAPSGGPTPSWGSQGRAGGMDWPRRRGPAVVPRRPGQAEDAAAVEGRGPGAGAAVGAGQGLKRRVSAL